MRGMLDTPEERQEKTNRDRIGTMLRHISDECHLLELIALTAARAHKNGLDWDYHLSESLTRLVKIAQEIEELE